MFLKFLFARCPALLDWGGWTGVRMRADPPEVGEGWFPIGGAPDPSPQPRRWPLFSIVTAGGAGPRQPLTGPLMTS